MASRCLQPMHPRDGDLGKPPAGGDAKLGWESCRAEALSKTGHPLQNKYHQFIIPMVSNGL